MLADFLYKTMQRRAAKSMLYNTYWNRKHYFIDEETFIPHSRIPINTVDCCLFTSSSELNMFKQETIRIIINQNKDHCVRTSCVTLGLQTCIRLITSAIFTVNTFLSHCLFTVNSYLQVKALKERYI